MEQTVTNRQPVPGGFTIHAGFSKTGTTTLQRHLFARHSQIDYLGKPYHDDTFRALVHRLMMEETLTYDPAPLKKIIETMRSRPLDSPKRTRLLSDEMFLSYSKVRDKGVVAQRIRDVFSPCKIVITIRSQLELLKSAYLSRGRLLMGVPKKFNGLGVTFGQWLTLSRENLDRGYLSHADYIRTIDYYAALFGRENVRVLLLEEFIENKEAYITALSEFLGIGSSEAMEHVGDAHEHREIAQAVLDHELLRTRFSPFHEIPPVSWGLSLVMKLKTQALGGREAQVEIPGEWRKYLTELYRPGNRRLMEDYRLPLEKYDYPV